MPELLPVPLADCQEVGTKHLRALAVRCTCSAGASTVCDSWFVYQAYDERKVCYALLAQRILAALPQTDDGVWLLKSTEYGSDTFAQVC